MTMTMLNPVEGLTILYVYVDYVEGLRYNPLVGPRTRSFLQAILNMLENCIP